jgi:hypothetical protein
MRDISRMPEANFTVSAIDSEKPKSDRIIPDVTKAPHDIKIRGWTPSLKVDYKNHAGVVLFDDYCETEAAVII